MSKTATAASPSRTNPAQRRRVVVEETLELFKPLERRHRRLTTRPASPCRLARHPARMVTARRARVRHRRSTRRRSSPRAKVAQVIPPAPVQTAPQTQLPPAPSGIVSFLPPSLTRRKASSPVACAAGMLADALAAQTALEAQRAALLPQPSSRRRAHAIPCRHPCRAVRVHPAPVAPLDAFADVWPCMTRRRWTRRCPHLSSRPSRPRPWSSPRVTSWRATCSVICPKRCST